MLEAGTLRAPGERSRSRNVPPQHIGGWFLSQEAVSALFESAVDDVYREGVA